MPNVTRTHDLAIAICSHGLPCCPHVVVGYHGPGSADVRANGRGIQRQGDFGVHTCPHCGVFMCVGHSPNVGANGRSVHRTGDLTVHFCGTGISVTGSNTVRANG